MHPNVIVNKVPPWCVVFSFSMLFAIQIERNERELFYHVVCLFGSKIIPETLFYIKSNCTFPGNNCAEFLIILQSLPYISFWGFYCSFLSIFFCLTYLQHMEEMKIVSAERHQMKETLRNDWNSLSVSLILNPCSTNFLIKFHIILCVIVISQIA